MAYPRSTSNSAHYVGLGKQTVKGTPVAPTVFVPYKGSVTHEHGMAGEDIREAGLGPYVSRTMKTAHDPSGGFGLAWRPATMAKLAAWFLGADAISGAAVPYTHTLTPDEAARIWLTVEQAAGTSADIIDRHGDALIKSLSIALDGNQDLMAQVAWFALTPAWQATVTATSYETGVSGISAGGPYRGTEATYTVDGSVAANVKSFEIGLEWKYDEDIRLSKVTRGDALKLELTGTVKIKQLIDSTTVSADYRKINYGTTTGVAADKNFYSTGAFIAAFDNGLATTSVRDLTITVPSIDWKTAKYTELNPDGATMYLEREGVIKKASATAFITIAADSADTAAYI